MKKWIIANQKMYHDVEQTISWAEDVRSRLVPFKYEVVVCPTFICLKDVARCFSGTPVRVGAQDVAASGNGAQTGEVSAKSIVQAGGEFVIVGHSERRAELNKPRRRVRGKLLAALEGGLTPIVCLPFSGKTAYKAKLRKELGVLLAGVKQPVMIAFEPSWAIGSGTSMAPSRANEILGYIKAQAKRLTGLDCAAIYGGSVDEKSAAEYLKNENIDGLLIGSAAKDPERFIKILGV